MLCTNCKKKQQQKTIAELFNVNDLDISKSKNAALINKAIIDILKQKHKDKSNMLTTLNTIFKDMFSVNIAEHYQTVSTNNAYTYDSNDIAKIQTFHTVNIRHDTYSFSNMKYDIKINFKYEVDMLTITLDDLSYGRKYNQIFHIQEKNDLYVFLTALSVLMKNLKFKYNTEFDMKSNILDNLFNQCKFTKIKKHNEKTVSKLLDTMSDCEKITNMFLTADKQQRYEMRNKLLQTINM
jgi:hypothetical protein